MIAAIAVMFLVSDARGLDPNRLPSQYVRAQWSVGNEFPGGSVNAITQSPDGYLWIGTDTGLVRFDGFKFTSVSLAKLGSSPNLPVLALLTDNDGKLWVRRQGADVLRQNGREFEAVTYGSGPANSQVTAIANDSAGGILISDITEGTFRWRRDQFQKIASPAVLPGSSPVISMAETEAGKTWMGTLGAGLFEVSDSGAVSINLGLPDRKINCLLPVNEHELWIGTDTGLYRWNGKLVIRVRLPASLRNAQIVTMLRDRDSNIWVGSARGLLRIDAGRTSFSDESAIRGNGGINALFEDREGNLWVGGPRGLGRIRDSAFVTYSTSDGLPSKHNGPIYVDSDGRTWLAPAEGGLYTLKDGHTEAILPALLRKDVIYSISGRKGAIWIGRQHGGLTRLWFHNGSYKAVTYRDADGLAQNSVYSVYQSGNGPVWAGTLSGGVSEFRNGKFTNYTSGSGLASNTVFAIAETRDGRTWFATRNGLTSLSNGRWTTFTRRDGLPADEVHCLFEDSSGTLWSGTSNGLAFLSSGHFEALRASPDPLHEEVFGIAEDKQGWLWIATSNHVLRVRRDKLWARDVQASDIREYGPADGLAANRGVSRSTTVVADAVGRIWFSLAEGISMVDPSQLGQSSAPAIVHIEQLLHNGTPTKWTDSIRVPPSAKRVILTYTAVSLGAPERIRFRYLLDGFDRGWSDPVAQREAVYTNLGPGSYRFRVVASNTGGEWNGSESSVAFEVEPAFWQTWRFRFAAVALAGLFALLTYRFHLARITNELNMRFEERLAERTRIAQELHDTLLQGYLSASMQLHVADDRLQETSPAKPIVRRVLELMTSVIEESRNAVSGLRSSLPTRDLHEAFSSVPEELGSKNPIEFRIIVEGQSRPLRPVVRDDVYRLGREALVNAFRHSEASRIQVEVEYGNEELRVLVQDNGRGIEEQVLTVGKDGHWGLPGMRERAERIGARLRVWSHPERGTEVEISVPHHIAFESNSRSWASIWFAKFHGRKQNTGSNSERRAG